MYLYLSILTSLVSLAIAATPAEWRSQSIYFMLTDRFARTDESTTASCDAKYGVSYCTNSFALPWKLKIDRDTVAALGKLDYIQGMGFTAIWITPITAQMEGTTSDGSAYHGYWQQDIYGLNPEYGTADDLKSLISALHDRDMYMMVDVVANHMGYEGSEESVDYSVFDPFDSQKYFHPYCEVSDYSNETNVQECWLGDSTVSLPDLDTEREDVQSLWYDWIGSLVSNYSIDGLRVDTVRHVQKDFWPNFNRAAGVYCIGEVFDGNADFTCPYQKVMDGVLNYPLYFPLLRAFKSTSGSMSDLYNMINTVKSTCSDSTLLGNFAENHDNPRFASFKLTEISYTDDMSLAKNAVVFTIMADGIPIIYAGQEQHYNGGSDPYNREAVWLSGYDTNKALYKLIATGNAIRSHAIRQDDGYLSYKNYPIYQDDTTLAMRKGYKGTQTITILSNKGADGAAYTLDLPNAGYEAGTKLTEVISCSSITVGDDGKIPVQMEGGLPRILYPASQLKGANICS